MSLFRKKPQEIDPHIEAHKKKTQKKVQIQKKAGEKVLKQLEENGFALFLVNKLGGR